MSVAIQLAKVSRRTVYNWLRAGKLETLGTGQARRYLRAGVLQSARRKWAKPNPRRASMGMRYAVLALVRVTGTVREAASAMGINRGTIHAWMRADATFAGAIRAARLRAQMRVLEKRQADTAE